MFYNAHGFGEETRLDLALLVQSNHILGLEQVKQLFLGILDTSVIGPPKTALCCMDDARIEAFFAHTRAAVQNCTIPDAGA